MKNLIIALYTFGLIVLFSSVNYVKARVPEEFRTCLENINWQYTPREESSKLPQNLQNCLAYCKSNVIQKCLNIIFETAKTKCPTPSSCQTVLAPSFGSSDPAN